MPRKASPEEEYDPIRTELARTVAEHGRGGEAGVLTARETTPPPARPRTPATPAGQEPTEKVVTMRPRARTRPAPAEQEEAAEVSPLPQTVKRFQVTEDEDFELTAFIQRLQQKSRTKVGFSVVARALFSLALHAETQILEELGKGRPMVRPANNDALSLAEFEAQWVQRLAAALRKTSPPQPD